MSPYKKKPLCRSFTFEGKRYWVYAKNQTELDKRYADKYAALKYEKVPTEGALVRDVVRRWLEIEKKPNVSEKEFKEVSSRMALFVTGEPRAYIAHGKKKRKDGSTVEWNKKVEMPTLSELRTVYDDDGEIKHYPHIGNLKVEAVDYDDLALILNYMNEAKYSKSYMSKVRNDLKQLFTYARRKHYVTADPAADLTVPKRIRRATIARRAITDEERELINAVSETHRAGTFIQIMLNCGMRPSEVAALDWEDIDFTERLIHVHKAVKGNGKIGGPKSSAGTRFIPIPAELLARLEAIKGKAHEPVCTNAGGNRLTRSTIQDMWSYFKREMNIAAGVKTNSRGALIPPLKVADDLCLYCLRHTYCTDLHRNGIPLDVAAYLMGHADIALTKRVYQHADKQTAIRAQEIIDNLPQKGQK